MSTQQEVQDKLERTIRANQEIILIRQQLLSVAKEKDHDSERITGDPVGFATE